MNAERLATLLALPLMAAFALWLAGGYPPGQSVADSSALLFRLQVLLIALCVAPWSAICSRVATIKATLCLLLIPLPLQSLLWLMGSDDFRAWGAGIAMVAACTVIVGELFRGVLALLPSHVPREPVVVCGQVFLFLAVLNAQSYTEFLWVN